MSLKPFRLGDKTKKSIRELMRRAKFEEAVVEMYLWLESLETRLNDIEDFLEKKLNYKKAQIIAEVE